MHSGSDAVKKLGLAITISGVVHAIVVTAAVGYEPPPVEKAVLDTPKLELVTSPPDRVPVEFVMLDAADLATLDAADLATLVAAPLATPDLPQKRATATPYSITSTSTSTSTSTTTTRSWATATEVGPHTPSALFTMRGTPRPGAVDLRLPAMRRDGEERIPRGTDAVVAVEPTGELAPSGNGTYRSNKGVFTARVQRDGSVDLKDGRNLRITWPDPRKLPQLPKALGKSVAAWYAKDDKTPGDPEQVALNNHRGADKDTRPDHGNAVPVMGGGFDITDALMRRKKIDPYAAAKLRYLDATRAERVHIGTRYKQQQLARSAQLMQQQLDVLTASTAPLTQKKQALFELWDDCAETGETAIVEGGRAARALVVGYIRARLIGGKAYTSAELAAFNRRKQSKAAFEPY